MRLLRALVFRQGSQTILMKWIRHLLRKVKCSLLKPALQNAPSLADLDGIMNQTLQQFYVPGGSLAVAHKGKLVYAKGFGVANLRTQEPVTPNTLFNLASCTKTISAFGVMRLVDSGRLKLDDTMYSVIGRPNLVRGMQADPRVAQITVRQLLHKFGGWNDDSGFVRASNEVQRLAPNGLPYSEAVKVLLATPLDYPPGTQAKYANGQWNLIKYIVECAAQRPYGQFLQEQLQAIGIHDIVKSRVVSFADSLLDMVVILRTSL